jgi:hypothetical protein
MNEQETKNLKEVASTIKDYLEILPSTRKIVVAVITSISTVVGILGVQLSENILNFFSSQSLGSSLGFVILLFLFGMGITSPFLQAFRAKRALFLKTFSLLAYRDQYLVDPEHLYKNSIYKLEDDLFKELDVPKLKKKEIPVDKIILIAVGGGIFLMLASSTAISTFEYMKNPLHTNTQNTVMIGSFVIVAAVGYWLLGIPLYEYSRRVKHNLL